MPGAFVDKSTGCITGLRSCSLPKTLWFWFAWLFATSLLVFQSTGAMVWGKHSLPPILCSVSGAMPPGSACSLQRGH